VLVRRCEGSLMTHYRRGAAAAAVANSKDAINPMTSFM
jgi:hypothetical protein